CPTRSWAYKTGPPSASLIPPTITAHTGTESSRPALANATSNSRFAHRRRLGRRDVSSRPTTALFTGVLTHPLIPSTLPPYGPNPVVHVAGPTRHDLHANLLPHTAPASCTELGS